MTSEQIEDIIEENEILLDQVIRFRKWLQWSQDRAKILTSGHKYGIAKWLMENPEPYLDGLPRDIQQ